MMQISQPSPRKPSGGRPIPTMISPKQTYQCDRTASMEQIYSEQQRTFIPPPSPRSQLPGQSRSNRSSVSSRPSPASNLSSARERMTIQDPHRQDSANTSWDDQLTTPKETWPQTPNDQHNVQIGVRDMVEEQFDHLLVCLVPYDGGMELVDALIGIAASSRLRSRKVHNRLFRR